MLVTMVEVTSIVVSFFVYNSFFMLEQVGKNFKILERIGGGSFGEIYRAINTKTNMQVAVKVEKTNTSSPQLVYECKLYNYLNNADPSIIDKGIANVYYGAVQGQYNVLVMDLMGPSLEDLFEKSPNHRFSLKTVLMLIDQMIKRIEYIHSRKLLHRDIKPDNFCIGHNQTKNKVFLIDFGLAKKYVHSNGQHIAYREGKNLTGTPRYASLNTHIGIQQSCRDDMESIGYIAMYFLRGSLPWQGIQARNKREKYEKIKARKLHISMEKLCQGHPVEFANYLTTCRSLKFEERPPYGEMRKMFKDLFEKCDFKMDYAYDWVMKEQSIEKIEHLVKEEG